MATLCPDCHHICDSLATCHKYQDFNLVVEQYKVMLSLRKNIQIMAPNFRGKTTFFLDVPSGKFEEKLFFEGMNWNTRFLTITFDPKKFGPNELSQPSRLHNYVLNALFELRNLFSKNIILIREFHKSGIPHYHMNYQCNDICSHAHLLIRLRYYFAKTLKNKRCIHDRYFNEGGKAYIMKTNKSFFTFAHWQEPEILKIGFQ